MASEAEPARWAGTLELLACDIAARPAGAPGVDDVAPHITGFRRESGALVVRYAPAGTGVFQAFVEAERSCCSGLGWFIEDDGGPQLRIVAEPAQLDAFEQLLSAPR
jgi:hypothetical protein